MPRDSRHVRSTPKRSDRLEDDLDRRRRQVRKRIGDFHEFVVRGAECAAFCATWFRRLT
jgi:hypothetical protein